MVRIKIKALNDLTSFFLYTLSLSNNSDLKAAIDNRISIPICSVARSRVQSTFEHLFVALILSLLMTKPLSQDLKKKMNEMKNKNKS